jgi:hypothetical protein
VIHRTLPDSARQFKTPLILLGQEVDVEVTTESDCYALILFNESGAFMGMEAGAISWTTQQGSYFLAISPTPEASGF